MSTVAQFPTAQHPGSIALCLRLNGVKIVEGPTVKDFLSEVIASIPPTKIASVVPFETSERNYLCNWSPHHKNGVPFRTFGQVAVGPHQVFFNTNQPRFFALRKGAELLMLCGFKVEWIDKG